MTPAELERLAQRLRREAVISQSLQRSHRWH